MDLLPIITGIAGFIGGAICMWQIYEKRCQQYFDDQGAFGKDSRRCPDCHTAHACRDFGCIMEPLEDERKN